MKALRVCLFAVSAALIVAASGPADAFDQPPVNLGYTSFLDGGPPAGPGWYFQEYLQLHHVDQFNGSDGKEITGEGTPLSPDLDVWISLNQLIYQSQNELLGGKWGLDVIVPVVYFDLQEPNLMGLTDSSPGVGDLYVGAFVQWDPIMGEKGPIFMHRFEFAANLPTGRYDKNAALNVGTNTFSIDPYWAGTLWLTPHLTTSWRIHYLWSDRNPDTGHHPGDAIHSNFAMAYEVLPNRLRVGVNGYHLNQIENSSNSGTTIPDSREQVLAIGPGAVYHFSQEDHLFLNVYFETETENRPEGSVFQLRWTHHFH